MVRRFFIYVPSLMEIGLRMATRDLKKVFFVFVLFVTLGVAYFGLGTLTKCCFALYRSIFTGFGAFLEEETHFHIVCVILN